MRRVAGRWFDGHGGWLRAWACAAVWLALGAAAGASGAAGAPRRHWVPSWMAAPQSAWDDSFVLPLGMPRSFDDVTLRQAVRASIGGQRLRLVISNAGSSGPLHVARLVVGREAGGGGAEVPLGRGGPLTVPPGARWASGPVALPVAAGERLRVDVHVRRGALGGFHWDARDAAWLLPGDATAAATPASASALSTRAFVAELLVERDTRTPVVVALGDSITDGNGATPGRDRRWPDHLARRLAPHGVAVLNAGISGNRLLRSGMGDSGLARLQRDVLRHANVAAVIVLLGTNDIGWPGGPFAPAEAPATVEQLAAGFTRLAGQARARGVRVIGGTLPPFERALEGTPLEGHHSPEKERLRVALNAWIRGSGVFDAVADFDAVLRDPARPSMLRAEFDSGDHLHPGDAGYAAMADAIDTAALLGARRKPTRR